MENRDERKRTAVVGIGVFGARVAADLRQTVRLDVDAVAITDRPGDWTALPSIVVEDGLRARQLGTDLAEFVTGHRLVFLVGDAGDPLYAPTAPWIAALAREFGAGAVEVVRTGGETPGPSAGSVAMTVAVDDDGDACAAVACLFDATDGCPRLGAGGDTGGLATLGLGRTARFTHVHAHGALDELALRAARRVGPADTYLAVFCVAPDTDVEEINRAASLIGQGRTQVCIAVGKERHGRCLALFAIGARPPGGRETMERGKDR